MKKYHYLYLITNKINNHFYFGIHSTNDLNDGYMGSGTKLKKAKEKFGINVFEKIIIAKFKDRNEALLAETFIVNEDMIKRKDCYNVIIGGRELELTVDQKIENLSKKLEKELKIYNCSLD